MSELDSFYDKFLHDLPDDVAGLDASYEEQCVKAILSAFKQENVTTNGMWQAMKRNGYKFKVLRDDFHIPLEMIVADYGKDYVPVSIAEIFKKPKTAKLFTVLDRTKKHIALTKLPMAVFIRTTDIGNAVIHGLTLDDQHREYPYITLPNYPFGMHIDTRAGFCISMAKRYG